MQFNTKLNIGDQLWYIWHGKIQYSPVRRIFVEYKEDKITRISYGCDEVSFYESSEGTAWWTSREELVKHLVGETPKEKCCGGHCQCTGGNVADINIEDLLKEMMSEAELEEAFNRFFEVKSSTNCGSNKCEHQDLEGVLSDMPKFQSGRPKHVTEEEAFVNELTRQSKKLTKEEMEKIDEEFDQLFGEHVCSRPKAKTKNELNQLCEELFE